jgi:hypothetical protein
MEVKKAWSYASTSPYVFKACYFIKNMDKFTFASNCNGAGIAQ